MGRIEILTGVERRRDWSDVEKLSILQEAAEPVQKLRTSRVGKMSNHSRLYLAAELCGRTG